MADWYVSSAAYAGYTAFQVSHAYSIGDLIVPTAPVLKNKWVLRCTTAGTSAASEPTWSANNNANTTSGTAIFQNVTGQSAYFWSAAAGDIPTLIQASGAGTNRVVAGDRIYVSSDHSESFTLQTIYGCYNGITPGYGVIQTLCVDRAGSTPPVPADLTTGAICTVTGSAGGNLEFSNSVETYHYGMTYVLNQTASAVMRLSQFGVKTCYFKNCILKNLSNVSGVFQIQVSAGLVVLDNTTLQFGHIAQAIGVINTGVLQWINTPNAIQGAIIPTILFDSTGNAGCAPFITLRGVDLSALTTTLMIARNSLSVVQLESCKIANGLSRYSASVGAFGEEVQLNNCYDGTNFISERYEAAGSVTTEFSTTLLGGAADDVGSYAHKIVTTANVSKFAAPLRSFWMDRNFIHTGLLRTATVEIVSSTTLKNDEIALFIEYDGTSGSPVTSFADSQVTTVLSTPANVPTSSVTWNNPPATPVKQKLQVTFTPLTSGRVRGQIRLGKASTTVYYNPQMVIS